MALEPAVKSDGTPSITREIDISGYDQNNKYSTTSDGYVYMYNKNSANKASLCIENENNIVQLDPGTNNTLSIFVKSGLKLWFRSGSSFSAPQSGRFYPIDY